MELTYGKIGNNNDIPMDLLLDADPSEELVGEYLPGAACFCCRDGEVIIGAVVMGKTRPGIREIFNVSVREPYRNRGIAKKLIALAVDHARSEGATAVEIGTGNPGAMQMMLYQKCGFRIMGVEFDHFRRHLPEPIFVDGIECRDMIRLRFEL